MLGAVFLRGFSEVIGLAVIIVGVISASMSSSREGLSLIWQSSRTAAGLAHGPAAAARTAP